jgi:hypothetical protein
MVLSFDAPSGEIGVRDRGGFQSRNASTAHLLVEAVHAVRNRLRRSFSVDVHTGDALTEPPAGRHLAYCAAADQPQTIMIPDFVFWGWPEAGIDDYEATRLAILEASRRPAEDPRLFWIGNPQTHPTRQRFLELSAGDPRIHAAGLQWQAATAGPDSRRLQTQGAAFVSLVDHCRYRYLIDLQGVGYSGRVKLLLFAGRPLFLQERRWREFFYDDLVPFEHYIPVREDLSDLSARIDWAEANPAHARRIAERGREFACANLCRSHAVERLGKVIVSLGGGPS